MKHRFATAAAMAAIAATLLVFCGCSSSDQQPQDSDAGQNGQSQGTLEVTDKGTETKDDSASKKANESTKADAKKDAAAAKKKADQEKAKEKALEEAKAAEAKKKKAADSDGTVTVELELSQDMRKNLAHGDKSGQYQKYIVLHDTEGDGDGASVVNYWDSTGTYVGAHFVVNKDGSVVQCVDMDQIAHHAGFGDTGHNKKYGTTDESRDDKRGTQPIGGGMDDYGMNSYSIGIEMVHVGGSGDYPKAQLDAVDALIAYIDDYYGFESDIIDHKAWRTGNSDTSPEFADYLANYQDHRTHE